jgi:hypothetical protein
LCILEKRCNFAGCNGSSILLVKAASNRINQYNINY